MTNLTMVLNNESGIQYQGVLDASSSTGTYPVIGLIVGTFRGGRTDKPMTITNANIKTMLGYDPDNPHYLAVQDVLNSGVPSVQVLRVAGDSVGTATPSVMIITYSDSRHPMNFADSYDVSINGTWYRDLSYPQGTVQGIGYLFTEHLNDVMEGLDIMVYWDSYPAISLTNHSDLNEIKFIIKPHDPEALKSFTIRNENTFDWDDPFQSHNKNSTVRITAENELVFTLSKAEFATHIPDAPV